MLPIVKTIELRTNDERQVLRLANVEKLSNGTGYRCELFVRSGGFSCDRPFYFDDSHFPDAVASLRQMNSGRVGQALIKSQWESDYLCFRNDELGHVVVTGEIIEYTDPPQSLKFAFETDQTILTTLIADFELLLNA